MPPVPITETVHLATRTEWRGWLQDNHATKREIWLVSYKSSTGRPKIDYIDAVEEAICFGWIDGIAKAVDPERTAQRFTPRRPGSNWTELNKDRARRLIAEGLMTDAGRATLPDLSPEAFTIAPDILAALQADPQTWANFQAFPDLYQRVRVSLVEEQRRNLAEFERRLTKLLDATRRNELYGRWQD